MRYRNTAAINAATARMNAPTEMPAIAPALRTDECAGSNVPFEAIDATGGSVEMLARPDETVDGWDKMLVRLGDTVEVAEEAEEVKEVVGVMLHVMAFAGPSIMLTWNLALEKLAQFPLWNLR